MGNRDVERNANRREKTEILLKVAASSDFRAGRLSEAFETNADISFF